MLISRRNPVTRVHPRPAERCEQPEAAKIVAGNVAMEQSTPIASLPMDDPVTMDSSALHCVICPRKPDFSDISHLLTHVSSKGHLSNYFKLKVKADQDPSMKATLQQYDSWYEQHNLQELLRDRMALKDKKKAGTAAAVSRRSSAGS